MGIAARTQELLAGALGDHVAAADIANNAGGGGGGTPGGSNHQIQYNNASAFGGIASSGTAGYPLIDGGSSANPSYATTGIEIDQSFGAIASATGSGTLSLNLSNNSNFTVTLTANTAITFTGGNVGQRFFIEYIQGGSGSYTVTYTNTVKWANKTQPTLTTAVGGIDLLAFYCPASATYHGGVAFPNIG